MKKVINKLDWKHILILSMILSSFIPTKADSLSFGLDFIYQNFIYQSILTICIFGLVYPIFLISKK